MPADAIPAGLPPDAIPAGLPPDAIPAGSDAPSAITEGGEQGPYRFTPEGMPVYRTTVNVPAGSPAFPAAAAMPEGGQAEPYNLWKQLGAGLESGVGATQGLASKSFNILDSLADHISSATGTSKGGLFRDLADYWEQQERLSEKEAARLAGGRQDFGSKLTRAAAASVPMLPAFMTGTAAVEMAPGLLTGPLGTAASTMGMMGAIENSDRGWQAIVKGAAEGTLMGKFMDVLGPYKKRIRLTGIGLYTYAQNKLDGVDDESALANAMTQMGYSGIEGAKGPRGEVGSAEGFKPQGFRDLLPPQVQELPGRVRDRFVPPPAGPAKQLIETAGKYDIPVTAGDITQHAGLKRAEVALEDVPGAGMQTLRAKQSEAAKQAARGFQEHYRQGLLDTDPSSIDDLQAAAEDGDQRARNVLERIQNAGDDPDRLIQASIGLQDWTTRQTAKDLYDQVQSLAEKNNLGDVPLNETGKAINGSLQQLRPAKLPNKEVIGLLQKIKESISPKLDEEGKPVVDENGKPVSPNNTYGLIRQLHSDLGERIREYYQGNNALIGEKGVGYLERVHNALEDDMRNYAQDSGVPEIVEAGRNADQYYRTARVPFKNGMLASAATSTEPDSIWQQFIKADKGDRARNFYEALDEKGRAAVRYNMVRNAVADATNPTSGVFSPQKFFSGMEKLKDAYGVFFNSQDLREITGFKNLMGHIVRAGQYAENPPTGQRAIPFILAGGIPTAIAGFAGHPMGSTISAASTVGLIGMARKLFTTEGGRRILLKAAGMKPGTPIMENYWHDVAQEAPKQTPPEEPPEGPPTGGGGGTPPPPKPSGGGAGESEQPAEKTGLRQAGGKMGEAITANMYQMLWDKVQKGDVTEAGQPSALLQAAKVIRESGGLKTIEDFRALSKDYAQIPRDANFQDRMHDLIDEHLGKPGTPAKGGGPPSADIRREMGPEEPGSPLYQRLQGIGDAALERIRQRGSLGGGRMNALPIPDMKDMTVWAASRIGQGIVDPAALRREIISQFKGIPLSAVREIAGRARDMELKNVRDYRLGMSLDDIHPLTSETIPLNPEVEPGLSKKNVRLYSGHEQKEEKGKEIRIWTPERASAEGPLAKAKSPSQLSYIDVAPEDVEKVQAGGEKGRKLMIYTPGGSPERATGLLTEDVQHYLQDMVRKRLGEIPDDAPDSVKMRRLLRYGRGEFAEQLNQPYSGVEWYGPDTAEGDRLLRQKRPELADPDFDTIQKAMSAAMSNNSNPQEEAFNGARIWQEAYDKWKRNTKGTLQFPAFQPDGKTAWPAQGATFQILKLNQMIKELGVHGAAEFLRDPQVTGRDIKHFVPNAKEIRLDEHFPGSQVLGPKIGLYFNQIMNLPMEGSVVDVWMMRRLGRILGNLFDARGQGIDAPRTEGERNLSMDLDARLAREHELATRDAQSVGWHYEQELYRRLGLNVKSFKRSDGIRKYLESLGLK